MIFESSYWKDELLKLSQKLSVRKTPKRRWTQAQYGTFEKEVMIGFYIIRKLTEAQKLSNVNTSAKLKGRRIPNNGKRVHRMNNHRFDEFYDFEKAEPAKFDLAFLCNQIIHSYIFAAGFEEERNSLGLRGIYFTSDEKRNTWLLELDIDLIIELFHKLGEDYPSTGLMHFDKDKNDYKIVSGDEEVIDNHITFLKGKLSKNKN